MLLFIKATQMNNCTYINLFCHQ